MDSITDSDEENPFIQKYESLLPNNQFNLIDRRPLTFIEKIGAKLSFYNYNSNNNIERNLEEYLLEAESVVGCSTTTIRNTLIKKLHSIPYGVMILLDKKNDEFNYEYEYVRRMNKISKKMKSLECTQYHITHDNYNDEDSDEWRNYSFANLSISEKDLSLRWTKTSDNFLILGNVDIKRVDGRRIKKFIPRQVWIGNLGKNQSGIPQHGLLIDNSKIAEAYMNHWNSMFLTSETIEYADVGCCFGW